MTALNQMRLVAIALLLCASVSLAQLLSPPDLDGLREASRPISKLNPSDRHAILSLLQIAAAQLRGEAVKADGENAFVIQGYGSELCSPTGNCSLWVFDAQHNVLLRNIIAQQYRYLPQVHDGRSDLLTTMHGSAFESDITIWRFDGHRYRKSSCAGVTYGDIDGTVYKRPRIKPEKCD
jgi:hypothetical protein